MASQIIETGETSGLDLVAGNLTTTHSLSSGEAVRGLVNSLGDQDWYAVELVAGQTYTFALNGFGQEAIRDPLLNLFDSAGTGIASNDDSGPRFNSLLTFTPTTTGTYYIASNSFGGSYTGEYLMTMNAGSTPYLPEVDVQDIADYLTHAYWLNDGLLPRQWSLTTVTYNVQDLTAERAALARIAFETWDDLIGMDFVETAGTANITIADNASGAFTTSTVSGGTITSSVINISPGWDVGNSAVDSITFQTFIHQIGQAIGLGNAGPYDSSFNVASHGVDNVYSNDSWQMSVMSYFSQSEAGTGSHRYVMTPMMADILAAQTLYGAGAARTGDTIYGFGSNAGFLYDFDFYSQAPSFTLYDTGGIDRLDASGYSNTQFIDLRGGAFSDIGGLVGNIGIYLNSVIENATGGAGNDTLIGNDAANVLSGGVGDDLMNGGAGNDVIRGGAGEDVMRGGTGKDRLLAEGGNDLLLGGGGGDVMNGGGGNDNLRGGDGDDVLSGGSGNDVLLGEGGDDRLDGAASADILNGASGNDVLLGGGGSDRLDGGGGTDALRGDAGNDRLFGGTGNDMLNGGAGDDRLAGDAGADRFVFQPNGSDDLVVDFQNNLDRLDFRAFDFANKASLLNLASQVGADVVFALAGGATVELNNFSINQLGAEDILI